MILFVPCLSLDLSLINRLADSIDYPVTKCAFNNGPEDALEKFGDAHPDWAVIDSPVGNLGCSGAWNQCAKLFPNEPNWLIANEDCWFLPGQLQQIVETAAAYPDEPIIYLNRTHHFYCFVWSRVGKDKFGPFDDNLFPGYYNDCDYRIRLMLGGREEGSFVYALDGQELVPHGKPRTGGVDYNAFLQGSGLLNRAYFRKKWGGMDEKNPVYLTPYRDHRLTYKDVIYYPEHRAELYPLWREFLNQPNPSIYD